MRKLKNSSKLLVVLCILTVAVRAQVKPHPDDKLYAQLVTFAGQITIENHPDLGKTPARNFGLLFQKAGCKSCLVLAISDDTGRYTLTVARGKYRVIAREARGGFEESHDLLSAKQARIIVVSKNANRIDFDISITLP
jgi:hypothetical protein